MSDAIEEYRLDFEDIRDSEEDLSNTKEFSHEE